MSALSPSSAQLLSLPSELLSHISSHLSNEDLIALSRSCNTLAPLATDYRLWTELFIRLPRNYGELPLVAPSHTHPPLYDTYEDGEWSEWAETQSSKAEKRRQARLEEMVGMILDRGDEARWRLVESVTVVQRPGATAGICQVLEHVQPNLRTLVLEGLGPCAKENMRRGQRNQSLEALLLQGKLSFPSLTTLSVGAGSIPFHHILNPLYLCHLAPDLTSLDFDTDQPIYYAWIPTHTYPRGNTTTKLRYLRIRCGGDRQGVDVGHNTMTRRLLQTSPELQQLHIDYDNGCPNDAESMMEGVMAYPKVLRDLYIFSAFFHTMSKCFEGPGLESVRRIAIKSKEWRDVQMSNFSSSLPVNVEELYFVVRRRAERRTAEEGVEMPLRAYAQCMLPNLVQCLERSPRLRFMATIKTKDDADIFFQLDNSDRAESKGFINSYRNVNDEVELFHAHMLLDHADPVEDDRAYVPYHHLDDWAEVYFKDCRGNRQENIYFQPIKPSWQSFTDYDMLAVPLEIIERMRVVEGASEAGWKGRGVEVGDDAWAVLVDWKTTVLTAFEESDDEVDEEDEEGEEDEEDGEDEEEGSDENEMDLE